MKKGAMLFFVMVLVSLGFVSSAPQIEFVNPTPPDGTGTLNLSVEINVSITEANLNEMKFNRDGVNYSFYDDSLVLMMNFDNVSALGENDNLSVDVSKYGNNGTVSGGAVWNSTGKYGGAYEFDGVNDKISIPQSIPVNTSFSISLWMKRTGNTGTTQMVFEGQTFSSPSLEGAGTSFNYYLKNTGAGWNSISTGVLTDGVWYHIVATYDEDTNQQDLFVNDISKGNISADTDTSISSFYLGNRGDNSLPFNGTIDEIRIFNRSLSSEEIEQLYLGNLYKYDFNKWIFYTNESSLKIDDNSFSVIASNSGDAMNSTGTRIFKILFKTTKYYDDRKMAVVWTGDDMGAGTFSGTWLNVMNFAQSKKVVFSPSVITSYMSDEEWISLQEEVDEGFVSPVSHSHSHENVPYENYILETCGSKSYIENNLTLPWQNQFNGSGFMVGWVAPYGDSDAFVRGNLSECGYLNDRKVGFGLYDFVSYNTTDGFYGRSSATVSADKFNVTDANFNFDQVYSLGGVYHLYSHPYLHNWSDNDTIPQILNHIGNRTDVWYAGWGQLYTYHYIEDQLKPEMNISSRNDRRILAQTNISSTERNKYGLSYPVTYAFSVPHVWNNSFVFYKNLSTDNYTLMEEKTRDEYWIGIDAYRNNLTEHAVYVSKGFPQESNDLYFKIVPILSTNFNGSTTNFETTELSNLTNLILEKQNYGKINFTEEVNLSAGGNLNTYVNISNNYVSINSTALSELNKVATITLYNVELNNPRIMKDSVVCPSTICTEVSYSGGNYTFTVTGFSNYSIEETPSSTTDDTTSSGSGTGTYKPSESSLENGFSVNILAGQKVQITYSNGKTNLVEVESVDEEKVIVFVDSVNYEISLGSSVKIDLDNDGFYDVEISNKKFYSNGIANLEFKLINEEVPFGEQEEQKSNVGENIPEVLKNVEWYVYVIIGVIVLLIVVGIVLKKRK